MGTTAEKLAYLNDTKTAIKDAIIAKGVEVPEGTTFRGYADLIVAIPSGSRKVIIHFSLVPYAGMANYAYTINNVMIMPYSPSETYEMALLDGQNFGIHPFNVVCACNMDGLPVSRVETAEGQKIQVYIDTNFSYFYVPDDTDEIYMYAE